MKEKKKWKIALQGQDDKMVIYLQVALSSRDGRQRL
jgi:hypothetical protein